MARRNLTFRQADVIRAIKAVVAAGVEVARVEFDKDGKIVIVAGKPEVAKANGGNEWDRL